ncbi:RidA family protein [Streptomyces ardesiacus]|uniref:RidA family protein n=1 Tax=unclassified Streptomyces TaxID=2593676 RepID=UPI0007C6FDD6|nr:MULTISPECIES: RidA family protein [unclassified Streptomyces]
MSVTRVSPPSVHNPSDQITQVVTVDGRRLVHLSGQVAWDERGRPVGLGDHGAQAAQIARNLDAALAAVGATRDDIVDETVYVVDYTPELLPAIFGPLRAGVAEAPASTLVGVSALCAPGLLLEVKVVAALPGSGSQDRAVPADAGTEAGEPARAHETDGDQDLETALTRRAWEWGSTRPPSRRCAVEHEVLVEEPRLWAQCPACVAWLFAV